jgi:hypothetical protein
MTSSKTPSAERIALLRSAHQQAASPRLPETDDVVRALQHVLRSQAFRRSAKLKGFLRFLVEEALAGRSGELTAARIAERVFGKGPGFKNSEDSVVRVAANRLRTALALYNGSEGLTADILIGLKPGSYIPVFSFRPAEKGKSDVQNVVQQYEAYLGVSSAGSHAVTYRSALEAVRSHPESAELLAIYAVLTLDTYLHGYGESPVPVDQAWRMLEKARSLSPANPLVQFSDGFLALTQGELAAAETCGRALLCGGRDDETVAAQGAWLIAMTLDPREIGDAFPVDLSDTNDYPGWMHHPRFLASYEAGDYEGALGEAIAFGMPRFFWGPLERAAALAQLGLRDAAEREIRRAAALNHRLARDPALYLKFYIPNSDTLEHVREGLEKAGLHRVTG